jgi:hypothetical protein
VLNFKDLPPYVNLKARKTTGTVLVPGGDATNNGTSMGHDMDGGTPTCASTPTVAVEDCGRAIGSARNKGALVTFSSIRPLARAQ